MSRAGITRRAVLLMRAAADELSHIASVEEQWSEGNPTQKRRATKLFRLAGQLTNAAAKLEAQP